MFILSLIIGGLGIVSAIVSIYMFFESRKHPAFKWIGFMLIMVTVGLLVVAFINPKIPFQQGSTNISENLPLQVTSTPHYAKVAVTLLSVLLPTTSSEHLQLNFLFKNNGENTCRNIKFHTITLIDSTGTRYHVIGQTNLEWTLDAEKSIEQSPLFQEPPQQELRYNLRLSLDVGGCVNPTDISKNKYAYYQSASFRI